MTDLLREIFWNIQALVVTTIGVIGIFGMILYSKLSIKLKNTVISEPSQVINDDIDLEWQITPSEKSEQTRRRIVKSAPFGLLILGLVIIDTSIRNHSFVMLLILALLGIASASVYYFITYVFPYKTRRYLINETGINVEKGDLKKYYSWNEFEYFFGDPDRKNYDNQDFVGKNRSAYFEELNNIDGRKFYIKLKPTSIISRIIKNVLVIHSDPESNENVYKILSQKLEERQGLVVSLIKYHFQ